MANGCRPCMRGRSQVFIRKMPDAGVPSPQARRAGKCADAKMIRGTRRHYMRGGPVAVGMPDSRFR